jgi:hypothetical protein
VSDLLWRFLDNACPDHHVRGGTDHVRARDALVRLLLVRGANPYDMQVTCNIHSKGNVLWYLEMVYEHTHRTGSGADWDDPEWRMFDMGGYGSGAHWHLAIAIEHNDLALARWCLAHGANPNATPARGYDGETLLMYLPPDDEEKAMAVAELLLAHGAPKVEANLG